jgi:hypothetical protein
MLDSILRFFGIEDDPKPAPAPLYECITCEPGMPVLTGYSIYEGSSKRIYKAPICKCCGEPMTVYEKKEVKPRCPHKGFKLEKF